MAALSSALIALGAAGAVGALAAREHYAARGARHSLLDPCADILDDAQLRHAPDGFPSMIGSHRGRRVHVELTSDTLVPRRLPQLWISVTLLDRLVDVPSLAILVRPAGYEYYSLTGHLTQGLDPTPGLPSEILIRGSGAGAERLLERLSIPLGSILAEPRVKEVAITSKGLRIISQAGEGRRGEHLLLRQAVFDNAVVPPARLAGLLDNLELLRSAIVEREQKPAARA
jgi:hypothetical protein